MIVIIIIIIIITIIIIRYIIIHHELFSSRQQMNLIRASNSCWWPEHTKGILARTSHLFGFSGRFPSSPGYHFIKCCSSARLSYCFILTTLVSYVWSFTTESTSLKKIILIVLIIANKKIITIILIVILPVLHNCPDMHYNVSTIVRLK